MGGMILRGETGENSARYQFVHHKAHINWLVMEYEPPQNETGG